MYTASRPERPFVEVGLIEAQQNTIYGDGAVTVLEKLRAHAAEQGCDAIIVTGSNDAVVGGGGGNAAGSWIATLHGYRASCIMYRDWQWIRPGASAPVVSR